MKEEKYSIDELIRYFEMAHKVMGWSSTDNSYEYHVAQTLKKLREERDEAKSRVSDLEKRIGDASVTLYDWDGYYDPNTKEGNAENLANLIEDVYSILQNKSWRNSDAQPND